MIPNPTITAKIKENIDLCRAIVPSRGPMLAARACDHELHTRRSLRVMGDALLRSVVGLAVASLVLAASARADAAGVPEPQEVLGFRPGEDFRLARWPTIVDYFRQVDAASDRVVVRELGRSTEGNPYIVAIVSSAETVANLDRHREIQRRLADPRLSAPGEGPAVESKPVVLITCSIHSSETASTYMATELLHDLAARDDPATREVLDNTILLLVPSANPDGIDKVTDWYEQSRGKPWEGEGMPWLYHKYAGHDTNRDWFMLNLRETQILSRLLYREWFPTITYDVHQMGSKGARLFVPPFHDPVNPNIDPRISQGISLLGAHMAADLAAAGKKGILTNAMYDNWWNGGNRTTPQRHNMVGVLTEAASVRLASPIFVDHNDLGGTTRGFASHRQAVNFVDPWPGGWWRLRDVVDYELIAARSVLTLAARYRVQFQANLRAMAVDAIQRGRSEPPYAWVVPPGRRDPATADRMVGILRETGIEVRRASSPFEAGGVTYPAGTWILPAAQPYRAHLKDMMERQAYPSRFAADGSAEAPYDVAGWTLPLQMGVRAVAVAAPFAAQAEAVDRVEPSRPEVRSAEDAAWYLFRHETTDDFRLINALLDRGVKLLRLRKDHYASDAEDATGVPAGPYPPVRMAPGAMDLSGADVRDVDALDGRIAVAVVPAAREVFAEVRAGSSPRIEARKAALPSRGLAKSPVGRARLGLYQPWMPSMDEGWTRLVLDQYGFPYTTVHNAEIRAGRLVDRFDVILIPSIPAATLREGYARDATAPAYVGGLGADGAAALRAFADDGGTIVGLEDACPYLIDELDLPVTEPIKGLKTSQFYGPGSILRATVAGEGRLTSGMPDEAFLYFDRSHAFDVQDAKRASVFVRYSRTNPLESGWLLGPEKIQGKAAAVVVSAGLGRVILFGFPPQHRGQTCGTFRLLFNAITRD